MATIIIMPKQGQSVESCILTELNKKKGDTVAEGDILFAYETDKASFEEEAKTSGTVLDIFFNEGDEIPVLTNVMVIGNPGEDTSIFRPGGEAPASETEVTVEPEVETAAALQATLTQTATVIPVATSSISTVASGVSPRARMLAEKEAVNIDTLKGSGPKGRIIERDVQEVIASSVKLTPLAKAIAKESGAIAPEVGSGLAGMAKGADMGSLKNSVYSSDSEIKPMSNMRKLIAKAMHASLQNSAQLTHHLSADARRILELREKVKKAMADGYTSNITLNDMVCLAVIKALKQYPQVNAHFLGDSTRQFSKVHLGLAVDTERGLMVPAVKNADDLTIQGLSSQLKEIAAACKKGAIDPDLLSPEAASFTVSNLGNYGVEMFTPVINLPQAAILGVNTIIPRPKNLGGGVYGFVPHIGLSLTYDHRALDGGEATRFLKQIAIEIETLNFEL